MADPISQRMQLEIGVRFDLMPPVNCGWKKWAFDPFFGITLPGQVVKNPRTQLPKVRHWVEGGLVSEVGEFPQQWHWTSRGFWLRAGCRLLGLDIGFGLAWRRKVDDA